MVLLTACSRAPDTDPRIVSEWVHTLYGVVRVERLTPPVASRLFAYATTAIYAGLATASPSAPSLGEMLNGLPELPKPGRARDFDASLAAVAAERVVLDSLLKEALPTSRAAVARLTDSLQRSRTATGISEQVRSRSEELGRRIGIAIVAWSRSDGFDSTRGLGYVAPVGRGLWVNDAPASIYASQNLSGASEFVALDNPTNRLRAGNASDRALILNRPKQAGLSDLPQVDMTGATEPYWGRIRPFVLERWNECPIPDPPIYSTAVGSPRYEESKEVYDTKMQLTPEQRTIALYWADNPAESGTPAGHWLAIASQVASQRHLSAEDAARLVTMAAVASADAFIAAWGYKYQSSVIRPRTYIRRVIDPQWEPLIPTPPFPEYPSGHSTQSAAAATVMTALLGDVAFDDSTAITIGHAVRRFTSFDVAAEEAGWSRIYGGIHFHSGKNAGKAVGQCIGETIVARMKAAAPAR